MANRSGFKGSIRAGLTSVFIAIALTVVAAPSSANAGTEGCFTASINGARAGSGLPALTVRGDLVAIARRHSGRMASSGTIFHNGNLAGEAPPDWQSLGENVGMGPTCQEIHRAFMNSSSHAANILDRGFNFVGVGVVIASDGTIYVTEVFMRASQPAPSPPAPAIPSSPTPSGGGTAVQPPSPGTFTAPPPPPPPPPGSKVTGKTKAYLDLLETESFPTAKDLEAAKQARAAADAAERREDEKRRWFLDKLGAFLAAVLSGVF